MAIALDGLEKTECIDALGSGDIAEGKRPGLPFTFTGQSREYFGIWIVNLLLSIVTLGIYSAWAKVRAKRYFYGNTRLDGSSFDYLASPQQILIGRVIAFVVLGTLAIGASLSPSLLPIYIFLYALVPVIIVRALRFNARHSSYRNVRFDFAGGTGKAYLVYLLLPILSFLTLGLLAPYTAFASKRFVVNGGRYGGTAFAFHGKAGRYYYYHLIVVLLGIALYFIGGVILFGHLQTNTLDSATPFSIDFARLIRLMPVILLAAFSSLLIYSYLTVRLQNYVFNKTRIGDHELRLDLDLLTFTWIRFSNLLAIILSGGLLIPWAQIRTARYQVECMSLIPHGEFETLVVDEQGRTRALGEEFGEGMDLDLGLGV